MSLPTQIAVVVGSTVAAYYAYGLIPESILGARSEVKDAASIAALSLIFGLILVKVI